MNPAQVKLLRELIDAEREHYQARLYWIDLHIPSRWIEVHGPRQRTAQALADAGLAELEGREGRQLWVRLV